MVVVPYPKQPYPAGESHEGKEDRHGQEPLLPGEGGELESPYEHDRLDC